MGWFEKPTEDVSVMVTGGIRKGIPPTFCWVSIGGEPALRDGAWRKKAAIPKT